MVIKSIDAAVATPAVFAVQLNLEEDREIRQRSRSIEIHCLTRARMLKPTISIQGTRIVPKEGDDPQNKQDI